jgi:hypothetical protein
MAHVSLTSNQLIEDHVRANYYVEGGSAERFGPLYKSRFLSA